MRKSRAKRYYSTPQSCPTVTSGVPQGTHVSPILIIFSKFIFVYHCYLSNNIIGSFFFRVQFYVYTQCRELNLADPIEHRVGHLWRHSLHTILTLQHINIIWSTLPIGISVVVFIHLFPELFIESQHIGWTNCYSFKQLL